MQRRATLSLRLRLPAVWLLLLLLAALLLPGRVWSTMLIGLGGMFAVAYVWARQMAAGLSATRQLRFGWMAVGDRLSEQFEIRNESWLPALWVEVLDQSTVPGYRPAVVRSAGPHAADRWRQSAVCQRRGQFRLGPWALRTADPFGVFQVMVDYPASADIIIHPPIHAHLPVQLPSGQSSGRARARERAWQATINAGGVRDYAPGDPWRWIHWPTTARKGELHVRQFDLDAAGDLWLLVDMERAAQLAEGAADGSEEQAVLLAASLAAQARQQSRAVGLVAYGRRPQVIPPGRGQGQQWRLLRALALANADGDSSLSAALRELGRTIQRGGALVVITPSASADWLPDLVHLARRGVRARAVLLDRQSFGGEGYSEGLRQALARLGFPAYVVRRGEIGRPVADEERHGFWEFKVLATGRVVTVRSPLPEMAGRPGR